MALGFITVVLKNPHQLHECPLHGIKIAVCWTVTLQFFNETKSYRCYMNLILSPFLKELLKWAIEKIVTSCKTVMANLLKLPLIHVWWQNYWLIASAFPILLNLCYSCLGGILKDSVYVSDAHTTDNTYMKIRDG